MEHAKEHIKVESDADIPVTYYFDEIERIEDDPEGAKIQQRVTVKPDSKSLLVYYADGKEIARVSQGKLQGTIPNGPVQSAIGFEGDILVQEYRDNKPIEGTSIIYDKNGNIPARLSLVRGKLDGIYKTVSDKGTMETFYKDGIQVGSNLYADGGGLVMESTYDPKSTEFIMKWFHKSGKLARETKVQFEKEIYSRTYDENGNLTSPE